MRIWSRSPTREATAEDAQGSGRVVTVSEIPEIGRNWWLFLVVGLVSIIAGILAIVYPDITLLALGIIVGVGLLFSGGIEIAEAIAGDMSRACWPRSWACSRSSPA